MSQLNRNIFDLMGGQGSQSGGLFGNISNIVNAFQPILDQQQQRSQQSDLLKLTAATNPSQLGATYGNYLQNQTSNGMDKQKLALLQRQMQAEEADRIRKLQQQEALKVLAQQYATQNGGSPLESFLGQIAATSGDISPLASLAVAKEGQTVEREKLKAEQDRLAALSNILSGGNNPPQPLAPNVSGPMNVRNNNAGNLRDPATGDFRSFNSPQEGLDAMRKDLEAKIMGTSGAMKSRYGEGYQPTLANVISTWAPPTENDTQGYIDFVSRETGLDANSPLQTTDIDKLIPAMTKMEGGQQAAEYFAPQTNTALQQLQTAAQIDPDKFAAPYLAALANDTESQRKQAQDAQEAKDKAVKTEKEDTKELRTGEADLRKEFEGKPEIKQFRELEGAYKRIAKARGKDSAAGDIALIYNFMKMQDPTSTVREGEYATAQNAAGIPAQVQNTYNRALKGERLSPSQRDDFFNVAERQYLGAEELFNVSADEYADLAKQYKFDPDRVVKRARQKVEGKKEAPQGVNPQIWAAMTPEEKALFQ